MPKLIVPADDREVLLRDVLSLTAVKAESVHEAADEYLAGTGSLAVLLEHRAELAAADALIEQLGWDLDLAAEAVELEAETELLRSTLAGTLGSVIDALSEIPGSTADVDVRAVRTELQRGERLLTAIDGLAAEA